MNNLKNLPKAITDGILFASLPKQYRQMAINAIDTEIQKEKERLHAQSYGVTVEVYRIINAFPELVDWSKVGKK